MKLKVLIVDDEPLARRIIEGYCSHLTDLEVIGSVADVFMARPVLESGKVNLLFIDINMPVLNGIDFIRTLAEKPFTVFTTAYKEYAHEAFDLAATDYLLKPFSLERFIQAVDKAKAVLKNKDSTSAAGNHTFIKHDGRLIKLYFDELCYIEAQGNQVKFVTEKNTFHVTQTFSSILELLPAELFVRTHRSFAVNIQKVTSIESYRVLLHKYEVPVGSAHKEEFMKAVLK